MYLYGEAARKETRRSLPSVRAGEYEALPEKVRHRRPIRNQSLIMEQIVDLNVTRHCGKCRRQVVFFLPSSLLQLKQDDWAPDFGPAAFVPSWGATVTGARKFLIAYNVNLIGTKEQAHRIALDVREQGRGKDQVNSCRCSVFPEEEPRGSSS